MYRLCLLPSFIYAARSVERSAYGLARLPEVFVGRNLGGGLPPLAHISQLFAVFRSGIAFGLAFALTEALGVRYPESDRQPAGVANAKRLEKALRRRKAHLAPFQEVDFGGPFAICMDMIWNGKKYGHVKGDRTSA